MSLAVATARRSGLMSAGHAELVELYRGKYTDVDAAWGDFSQGVPWTSSPDVGAPLNVALAQFATAGGARMQLPFGAGRQTTGLVCSNWNGVRLLGRGFGDFGYDGTSLSWAGAALGLMVDWRTAGGTQPTIGSEISDLTFEANGIAGMCLYSRSLINSVMRAKFHNPTYRAFDLDVIAGTQYYDVANNDFWIYFLADSAAAINASGLVVGPGSNILDTHSNRFHVLRAQFQNGTAFDIGNTDSNHFFRVYASRILGGTGAGMIFRAGSAVLMRCRSNTVYVLDMPFTPLIVEGTDKGTTPSENNVILFYNLESGMPAPTIGPGATLFGMDNTGQPVGNLGIAGPRKDWSGGAAVGATTQGSLITNSVNSKYRKVGREVDFYLLFNIAQAGGSGYVRATLPFQALYKTANFTGRSEITGKQLQAVVEAGSTQLLIIDCDNNYIGASGTGQIYIGGRYETNA